MSEYRTYEHDSVSIDEPSEFLDDHLARYYWISAREPGAEILDCACGVGYGSYILSQTAKKVVGIDLNPRSLETAQARFRSERAEFLSVDVTQIAKHFGPERFDVVVAFEMIEHLTEDQAHTFLEQVRRVLRKGGRLYLSTPNHHVVKLSGVLVPEFHIFNLEPQELRRLLGEYFESVEILGQFKARRGLKKFLFDLDFFNLRHRLFSRKSVSLLAPSPQANSTTTDFVPFRPESLEHWKQKVASYQFSSRHWRQAGLTVAIAHRGPR